VVIVILDRMPSYLNKYANLFFTPQMTPEHMCVHEAMRFAPDSPNAIIVKPEFGRLKSRYLQLIEPECHT